MSGLVRLFRQKHNPPCETTESFFGKTVLITGATSGLGLEAAKKLAILNASKLIITARTVERGEIAKSQIQQDIRDHAQRTHAKVVSETDIVVLPLDMTSMSNVQAFASTLESRLGGGIVDAVILNAGTNQRSYVASPDGYEETLQVNVISTALLAILVLPLLASASWRKGQPAHLTFVSSGLANTVTEEKMAHFLQATTPLKDLSLESSFPPGNFGGQVQYARSKLMLEYAMRHVATHPWLADPSGQTPKVIVNSTCPGMCKSDLGRQYAGGMLIKILIWVFFRIFARSASQGANSYISALTRDVDGHGVMWKDDKFYPAGEMLTSTKGKEFGDKVWEELKTILQGQEIRPEQLT